MANRTIDEQIADKEAEIVKLKAEQEKLKAEKAPKYPKHVQVPDVYPVTPRTHTVVVNSEAEEKAALASPKAAAKTNIKAKKK